MKEMEKVLLWTNDLEEYDSDHIERLGEILQENITNDYIYIVANNVDWRGRSGYKKVSNDQAALDLAREILPSYESTFNLYKQGDKLFAVVSSHDVPTGGVWKFHGILDIENAMEDIIYFAIQNKDDIEKFLANVKEETSIDLKKWNMTKKDKDDGTDHLFVLNLHKDICVTVSVDGNGHIESVDYCTDDLDYVVACAN